MPSSHHRLDARPLSLGPTIYATSVASGFEQTIQLDKAGMGAFLSLLGPALAIALAGGVGNLFMMSKQRDAELALVGITGATPNQRRLLPVLEAIILTVTAAIPATAALGVMMTFLVVSFQAAALVPGIAVPASAWIVGVGVTGLIMVAATFLPTLSALRLPEPRVASPPSNPHHPTLRGPVVTTGPRLASRPAGRRKRTPIGRSATPNRLSARAPENALTEGP